MKKLLNIPYELQCRLEYLQGQENFPSLSSFIIKILKDYGSGKLVAPSSIPQVITAPRASSRTPVVKKPYWKGMTMIEWKNIDWSKDPDCPCGSPGEYDYMDSIYKECEVKVYWKDITEEEFAEIDWSLDEECPTDPNQANLYQNKIFAKYVKDYQQIKARRAQEWKERNEESERKAAIARANFVDTRAEPEKYTQEEKWAHDEKTSRLHGDEAIEACKREWKEFYEERWRVTQGHYHPFATKETNYL
jgi:hypothetical protein